MSTTRWIIETKCDHDDISHIVDHPDCPGPKRIVVDPANLPPEAIQRAAAIMRDAGHKTPFAEQYAEAAVRAFLSDPEPGDA